MRTLFWSLPAARSPHPDLASVHPDFDATSSLPLASSAFFGTCFHRSRARADGGGVAILHITSPRPFRLWIGPRLAFDEALSWRDFQREIRAVLLIPVTTDEELELLWEFGPRPSLPDFVTHDCPSRNREKVARGLREQFPDALRLEGTIVPGVAASPLALRFSPAQFRREGVVWQQVLARSLASAWTAPSTSTEPPGPPSAGYLRLGTEVWPAPAHEATSPNDRAAGLRRFYVPVSAPGDESAPLRATGEPESRLEPRLEIRAMLSLRVATEAGGELTVAMPVYESLGRLAPVREFRATPAFPSPLESPGLLARLPEPILPARLGHLSALYAESWAMLLRLVRVPRPESGLPGSYVSTGAAFEHYQFVWDTCFATLALAFGHRVIPATSGLDLLYSRQHDGGYIHRENDVRDGLPALFEPDFSPNPPLLAVAEWRLFRLTGDRARLHRIWWALVAQHRWFEANRALPDGTFWTTGLANGLDNSPSLGDGYPDLTAQMAHHAEALAEIADALGLGADAAHWRARRAAVGEALNTRLWSESMRFYSSSLPEGGHNPNKVVTGFWPLWAGLVPPERVTELERHLDDPATFGRHHPVPSLAADSPLFEPEGCYWRGSTWTPTNHAVIAGLWRSGRHERARRLALLHLLRMHEVFAATGRLWENYSSETSAPGNWSGPEYCWTALTPVVALFEVVIGLEPDAPRRRLHWRPPESEQIGVRRYPLGDATIDLVQKHTRLGAAIEITTDAPFTLVVHRGDEQREFACDPGSSAFSLVTDW